MIRLLLILAAGLALGQDAYRVGSVFSRIAAEKSSLGPEQQASIVSIGRATGFYLGDLQDRSFFITNRHVIRSEQLCRASVVRTQAGVFPCRRLVGSWEEIDLAIIETSLVNGLVPLKFDTETEIKAGDAMSVAGFGRWPQLSAVPTLTVNEDDDCRAFLGQGAAMQLSDPDEINPTPGFVWSLPMGCDVMHGDSGAPVLSRGTGKVVGIVWTGVFPKPAIAQDSAELRKMLAAQKAESQLILNYMVPSVSIAEVLRESLSDKESSRDRVIRELILK